MTFIFLCKYVCQSIYKHKEKVIFVCPKMTFEFFLFDLEDLLYGHIGNVREYDALVGDYV